MLASSPHHHPNLAPIEPHYEPDLLILRQDLLLLAFYQLLEERSSLTIDDVHSGKVISDLIVNARKIARYLASSPHEVTGHRVIDPNDLELLLEFPWDLTSFQTVWDSWEDHNFVVVDDCSSEVFLTHAGMKRIQFLLESTSFSPLRQATTSHHHLFEGFPRMGTRNPTSVTLESFISFLMNPQSFWRHVLLVSFGYGNLLGLVFILLTARSQDGLKIPMDAILISELAIATVLSFTGITYLMYRWIMGLRTRQSFLWNNLERSVSADFLTFLNLVTLGAAATYLILHQLPRVILFPLPMIGVLAVLLLFLMGLIGIQVTSVKRGFIHQRMFYQQLYEILNNTSASEHDAKYLESFFSEKNVVSESLPDLAKKIGEFSKESLLEFIWQGSNYMVLYFVLMILYFFFEGVVMLMGKYVFFASEHPIKAHAKAAFIGGIVFLLLYMLVKRMLASQWLNERVESHAKKNLIFKLLGIHFYLRNILHDYFYAVHDSARYHRMRQQAFSVVTRFFEIFVIFSILSIIGYDLVYTFISESRWVSSDALDWLPFLFLIEGSLLTIIYAMIGIITWITTVEIPLNDLDVNVNRMFKDSSVSFVDSLFQHYLITPVLYHHQHGTSRRHFLLLLEESSRSN